MPFQTRTFQRMFLLLVNNKQPIQHPKQKTMNEVDAERDRGTRHREEKEGRGIREESSLIGVGLT